MSCGASQWTAVSTAQRWKGLLSWSAEREASMTWAWRVCRAVERVE
ncbi:MAG: hypothetical protein IPF99_40320 [Deltaproteobacteria bacterium]|nr:hypothetical protein [Deltaproteobacteria bacterium]